MHYLLWSIIVAGFGMSGWQLIIWIAEVQSKKEKYQAAVAYARANNKPLLVAGGPYGNRKLRHFLKLPAHGHGDICLDIDRNAIGGHPNAIVASVTDIPFADKSFGAAFASHLLEHLPTTSAAKKALGELNRTAEAVFIVAPSRQSVGGWLHPGHHLWVWQRGKITYFKQRGKVNHGFKEEYSTSNV